jgi:hypothetical protein
MVDSIQSIDAVRAPRILDTVIRSYRNAHPPELTGELRRTLALSFDLSSLPEESVTEEELAKQVLLVAAEDPDKRVAIEMMAAQSDIVGQKFDFGATFSLTVAALIVLQTHMCFERDKNGKWTVRVEKKKTSDALLRGLVQKLLGLKN